MLNDAFVVQLFEQMGNASIKTARPEIIFGKIYDSIGFNAVNEDLFRHLVIARLDFPLSKLKTVEYLYRFQGIQLNIDTICRFLYKLNSRIKDQVEKFHLSTLATFYREPLVSFSMT